MLNFTTLFFLSLLNFTLLVDYLASSKQFSQPEIGLEEIGTGNFNRLSIPIYRYTGECPDKQKGMVQVIFTSSETLPKQGRRVIIRNISSGLLGTPYTDREYSGERHSEMADVTFGTRHEQRYFIVRNGLNKFEYEIKQGNTILQTGTFNIQVGQHTITEQRDKEPVEKTVCPNDRDYCDWDERIKTTVYECPILPRIREYEGWE